MMPLDVLGRMSATLTKLASISYAKRCVKLSVLLVHDLVHELAIVC